MPRPSGRPSRQYLEDTKRMQEKRKLREVGMLTGGQAKIAAKAPPPNKIDAKDFAVLRAEKAKDRGMGLQDEKVKPGKVMKAKRGKAIEKLAKKKGLPVPLASSIPGGTKKGFFKAFGQFPAVPSKGKSALTAKGTSKNFKGYSKVFEGPQNKGRVATISGVKPNPKRSVAKSKRVTYKSMDEMRQKVHGYKPGESTETFKKRKANEAFAKRAAKATGIRGKIALGVAAAGVGAIQYLRSKLKKKEDKNKKTLRDFREQKKPGIPSEKTKMINKALTKKMGGGMMKVPGYSSGTTDPIKTFGPNEKRPPERRQKRVGQQARRSAGPKAGIGSLGGASSRKTLKQKLMSARIEGFLESTKDKVNPLKGDRVAGRGEKRVSFKPGEGASLSTRGTTGTNWRAGKDRIDEFVMSGDAEKNYKKTGKLFTNYSGKMMGGGMMNKPMGYKSGKSIKVKCKLGKNKPTKMY